MGYLANKYILFKNVHKISKICYFRLSKWEIPTTSNVEWRLLKPGIRDKFSVHSISAFGITWITNYLPLLNNLFNRSPVRILREARTFLFAFMFCC